MRLSPKRQMGTQERERRETIIAGGLIIVIISAVGLFAWLLGAF